MNLDYMCISYSAVQSQLSYFLFVFKILVILEQSFIILRQALVLDHQIGGLMLVQPSFLFESMHLVLVALFIVLDTFWSGLLLFEVSNMSVL